MKPSTIAFIAVLAATLWGCTGGNMGDTRGGGAAPGQSGGRDTTPASAAGATAPASTRASASTDTTKQRAKAKQP